MTSTDKLRQGGFIAYGLYAAAIIVSPAAIAGVIYAYLARRDVHGSYLEGHLTWLIRTFWMSLLLGLVGVLLTLIFVGWLLLLAIGLWYIYRVVKGFVLFNDGREIEDPLAYF